METQKNSQCMNRIRNDKKPERILNRVFGGLGKKLGACSLLAAVAISAAAFAETRSAAAKKSDSGLSAMASFVTMSRQFSHGTSLKLQSGFHLSPNAALTAAFAGNDDCPGKPIPEGNYTAAAPYIDSGDTTGANDTVKGLIYDFWDFTNTRGLDHVYSFTLTSRGANPEIRVSHPSGLRHFMYILDHRFDGCPVGTGNFAYYPLAESSTFGHPGVSIINSEQISSLPLNVQLYLFVDDIESFYGPGPYTLAIQDVTISASNANPIDSQQFFLRQHYLDFLNREPEEDGLISWLWVLNNCVMGDHLCGHEQRLTTSAGFFGSTEFHLKGYFAFRFYRTAFDRLPEYNEISADMQSVTGQTPSDVYSRKANFTNSFVQRPEFAALYNGLPNANYVASLMNRYALNSITTPDPTQPDGVVKVTLTQDQLVNSLDAGTLTRAQVLRAIADSDQVFQSEYNRAFVAMQYYGYLRRKPEDGGYNMWLNYLNTHPGDFREMVRGFVDSIEYRSRFGQPEFPLIAGPLVSINASLTTHEISSSTGFAVDVERRLRITRPN